MICSRMFLKRVVGCPDLRLSVLQVANRASLCNCNVGKLRSPVWTDGFVCLKEVYRGVIIWVYRATLRV